MILIKMTSSTELIEVNNSEDDTQRLFFQALNSIDIGDIDGLKTALEILPIEKCSSEDSSKFLNILLDQCR